MRDQLDGGGSYCLKVYLANVQLHMCEPLMETACINLLYELFLNQKPLTLTYNNFK